MIHFSTFVEGGGGGGGVLLMCCTISMHSTCAFPFALVGRASLICARKKSHLLTPINVTCGSLIEGIFRSFAVTNSSLNDRYCYSHHFPNCSASLQMIWPVSKSLT